MLSSRWTYVLKFIYAPFWILAFGAVVMLLLSDRMIDNAGHPPPPAAKYIFVTVWIIVSIGILRFVLPLKRVELRNNRLFVSNYRREWEIQNSDIESVHQSKWKNARPIRVRLRREISGIGSSFTFVPPSQWTLRFWRETPQVDTLRQLAEANHLPSNPR